MFRQLRGAGLVERFGTIEVANSDAGSSEAGNFEPEQVAITGKGLLVTGTDQTVIVPFNGEEPVWLAQLENAGSAGVDEEGAYAERVRSIEPGTFNPENGKPLAYELRQVATGSEAVRGLWQGSPGRGLETLRRHPEGWVAAGVDTFGEGRRAAIFWLRDIGQESYLGCGPVGSTVRSPIVEKRHVILLSRRFWRPEESRLNPLVDSSRAHASIG